MRQKSEVEKWLDQYRSTFKENYPLGATSDASDNDIIARIKECIRTNTPEAEPEYDTNADY